MFLDIKIRRKGDRAHLDQHHLPALLQVTFTTKFSCVTFHVWYDTGKIGWPTTCGAEPTASMPLSRASQGGSRRAPRDSCFRRTRIAEIAKRQTICNNGVSRCIGKSSMLLTWGQFCANIIGGCSRETYQGSVICEPCVDDQNMGGGHLQAHMAETKNCKSTEVHFPSKSGV